jgi:hypothetical protein
VGVDGLHFRVSSDRQTTENQFEELLRIAERRTTLPAIGAASGSCSRNASTRKNYLPQAEAAGPFTVFIQRQ